ncbi:MAG TPA: hypothetical protein VNN15_04000 [Solirubrobacterales bacterium]|nr:hypothetical protein [Solirubrobacterales bacterium]
MYKKLMLACTALAAFAAFVIAPAAQGAVLTEGGVAIANGSSITALNESGTKAKFTGGFGVECEVAHLKGTVTSNNSGSGTVSGEIPLGSATFTNAGGAACSSALGATTVTVTSKLCLDIAKGSDNVVTTGCGGNVIFDLKAAGITCKYETASVTGVATTGTGTVKVSKAPASEVGGIFFCPDTGELDMEFNVTTTNGTAVTLS